MTYLFDHTDSHGDRVWLRDSGHYVDVGHCFGDADHVELDRAEARRLYQALGTWLNEDVDPFTGARAPYVDPSRAIVREELKRMLALMGRAADEANGYDAGDLKSSALYAINEVVNDTLSRMDGDES